MGPCWILVGSVGSYFVYGRPWVYKDFKIGDCRILGIIFTVGARYLTPLNIRST